jgi:hypothetical protein
MYVMDMGWDRMSDDARARWLKEFRTQLITALGRTNHELKRLGHDGDTSPLAEAGAYQELGL